MRKWLGIGILSVAMCGAGAYWHFSKTNSTDTNRDVDDRGGSSVSQKNNNDGDAEASDVIEPLIVDRGPQTQTVEFGVEIGMQPRVCFASGMQQGPRPDADPRRMPYADQEEIQAIPLDPLTWILETTLPRLGVFEQLKNADPTEESEPAVERPAKPMQDFHQMNPHCPYHGPCPYRN